MKINKEKIGKNVITISLATAGIISTTTGIILNKMEFTPSKVKVTITEKRIAKKKTNIPKLKEIEVEVNMPISVNINDYIENIEEIDEKILKKFKLDTSLVNGKEPGTYTYTIRYKDKKYNGNIIVKEKELPNIESMTLKEINIEKNTALPKNLNDYIVEDIPEEARDKIIIDTSKVNISIASTYQYTVTYKDKIYTGKITVFEPQSVIKEENKPPKEEEKDKEEQKEPEKTPEPQPTPTEPDNKDEDKNNKDETNS